MADHYLTCFGVGDGWPCADRNHSSFLYRLGAARFLVDCGESISSRFKASGRSDDEIDRIFLTHMHCDHVGGLFMLLQGFWLQGRTKELTIHLPEHGVAPIQSVLRAACIFDEILPFRLNYEPLESGRFLAQGPVRITPFLTTHLEGFRRQFEEKYPNQYGAFSLLLESNSCRVGHSGDIGSEQDLRPILQHPLDLLVCELAHVEPETLFHYLAGRAIQKMVFVHLGRRSWEQLARTQELAARVLAGRDVHFARDGSEIEIG